MLYIVHKYKKQFEELTGLYFLFLKVFQLGGMVVQHFTKLCHLPLEFQTKYSFGSQRLLHKEIKMPGHIVVQDKYLCMEWKLIKIIQIFKIQNSMYLATNPHYPVPFFLICWYMLLK